MAETLPTTASTGSRQTFTLVDANTKTENMKSGGGCGCGGHGHGHGGCGCGGHGRGHGHRHGHSLESAAGEDATTRVEELEIHAIPKVVRRAVVTAAIDALPVGENLQVLAPHRPERLFAHLEESVAHYRVETVERGPGAWRYRITRIS